MRDVIVLGMLVLGFATFVTTHLTLVLVLLFRERPRWQKGLKKKVGEWVAAVVVLLGGLLVVEEN